MLNLHKFVADDYYKKGKANFKVQDGEGNEYPVVMTMNSTVFDLKEEIHYKIISRNFLFLPTNYLLATAKHLLAPTFESLKIW